LRLLELFAGSCAVSRAFAARGWTCICVDLVRPAEIPAGCEFIQCDVLDIKVHQFRNDLLIPTGESSQRIILPDFLWASSPCNEFSPWGQRNFHPQPPYPQEGIKLFNYTRSLCEALPDVRYVLENVRAAEQFVGKAKAHAGSFYLWGSGVPALLPKGIVKGFTHAGGRYRAHENRSITPKEAATIPPELANCVAEYAERLLEQKAVSA
jgi:hypothetical protein